MNISNFLMRSILIGSYIEDAKLAQKQQFRKFLVES